MAAKKKPPHPVHTRQFGIYGCSRESLSKALDFDKMDNFLGHINKGRLQIRPHHQRRILTIMVYLEQYFDGGLAEWMYRKLLEEQEDRFGEEWSRRLSFMADNGVDPSLLMNYSFNKYVKPQTPVGEPAADILGNSDLVVAPKASTAPVEQVSQGTGVGDVVPKEGLADTCGFTGDEV